MCGCEFSPVYIKNGSIPLLRWYFCEILLWIIYFLFFTFKEVSYYLHIYFSSCTMYTGLLLISCS